MLAKIIEGINQKSNYTVMRPVSDLLQIWFCSVMFYNL